MRIPFLGNLRIKKRQVELPKQEVVTELEPPTLPAPTEKYDPKFTALEKLIIRHEGLRLVAYLDPAGVPTIGYGHTRTVTHDDVGKKQITHEEAVRLLRDDLREPKAIATALLGTASGPKHRGITSFVYNLGPGALHGTTTQIARNIVNKDFLRAAAGMERYVYGGGRRLPGLVTRRREEATLVSK